MSIHQNILRHQEPAACTPQLLIFLGPKGRQLHVPFDLFFCYSGERFAS